MQCEVYQTLIIAEQYIYKA